MKQTLQQVQTAFDAVFDVPPRALRVWAKGCTVWCNAPLQYASLKGITKQEAVQMLLAVAPICRQLMTWHSLPNGMLETKFSEAFLLEEAQKFCTQANPIRVYDSKEPFFFEKCIAIRARRMLQMPQQAPQLAQEEKDLIADVLGSAGQDLSRSQMLRLCTELERRLDKNLKMHQTHDLTGLVLLTALEKEMKYL